VFTVLSSPASETIMANYEIEVRKGSGDIKLRGLSEHDLISIMLSIGTLLNLDDTWQSAEFENGDSIIFSKENS
jgi:hypothetical protein